jgi:hypothetical protein
LTVRVLKELRERTLILNIDVVPMPPAVSRLTEGFHPAVSGIQRGCFVMALLGFMIRGCHFGAPWCSENSG